MLIFQLQVKFTFLNGKLINFLKKVYGKQPLGNTNKGKENKVLQLKEKLHGLKQSLKAWNSKIDSYGFQ